MNWILLVMAAIGSVILAMIAGGLLTPRTRVTTRTLVTAHGAAELFALLRAADGPPRWCADLPTLRLEHEAPPHRVHFTIVSDDGVDIGDWQITVETGNAHTTASITETVSTVNPLLRFISTLGGSAGRTQHFLDAVAQQLAAR
jgi:hypothetical protein